MLGGGNAGIGQTAAGVVPLAASNGHDGECEASGAHNAQHPAADTGDAGHLGHNIGQLGHIEAAGAGNDQGEGLLVARACCLLFRCVPDIPGAVSDRSA